MVKELCITSVRHTYVRAHAYRYVYPPCVQAHTATALEFDNAMQPGTPIGYSSGGAERPSNRTDVEVGTQVLVDLEMFSTYLE